VIEGRDFTDHDNAAAEPVAVVSRAFARQFWSGQSALGRTFQLIYFRAINGKIAPDIEARLKKHDRSLLDDPAVWEVAGGVTWHVIGVVEDIRAFGLDIAGEPAFYLSYRQAPPRWNQRSFERLAIRIHGEPDSLLGSVKSAITSIAPSAQVPSVESMSALVNRSIGGRGSTRLMMLVSALFGALALLLTMSGIFGIVLHMVTQRLPEIGVRMALGADRADVARLLFGYAGRIIIAGLTLGTTIAWAVSRMLQSVLFGVTPTDLPTYAVSIGVLVVCVLGACLVPIRRAMRFDPTTLLRL
jgi:putative ABC transport system permease protein